MSVKSLVRLWLLNEVNNPGRPKQWSPWRWLIKIASILFALSLYSESLIWQPSPQSIKKAVLLCWRYWQEVIRPLPGPAALVPNIVRWNFFIPLHHLHLLTLFGFLFERVPCRCFLNWLALRLLRSRSSFSLLFHFCFLFCSRPVTAKVSIIDVCTFGVSGRPRLSLVVAAILSPSLVVVIHSVLMWSDLPNCHQTWVKLLRIGTFFRLSLFHY